MVVLHYWLHSYPDALAHQRDVEYLELHDHGGGPCDCCYIYPCTRCGQERRVKGKDLQEAGDRCAECAAVPA